MIKLRHEACIQLFQPLVMIKGGCPNWNSRYSTHEKISNFCWSSRVFKTEWSRTFLRFSSSCQSMFLLTGRQRERDRDTDLISRIFHHHFFFFQTKSPNFPVSSANCRFPLTLLPIKFKMMRSTLSLSLLTYAKVYLDWRFL